MFRLLKYRSFFLLFCLGTGALNNSCSQPPLVSSGSIKQFKKFPSKFVVPRNVDVWLPEGYNDQRRYAVLFMHDGQMLYDSSISWNHQEWGVDETMGKLQSENKIRNCIVVGIWNNGKYRHAEYFPQKALAYLPENNKDLMDLMPGGPKADDYLAFIVKELKPFIDSNFSTFKNQENTFIAGSSMGAMISMYAICEYPDVFAGAACLSTHWTGIYRANDNPVPAAVLQYFKDSLPSPKNHRFYFDHGTVALDSLYKPFQQQADNILKEKGYTTKNWSTKEFPGEDHSENAWRKRLGIPLTFLLKPPSVLSQ